MRANRVLFFALAVLAFSNIAHGSPQASNGTTNASDDPCAAVEQIRIPKRDLPNEKEKKELEDCDSAGLYYGYDKPPDFERARKCAYLEKELIDKHKPVVMGWAGDTLVMIYANGRGVPRNITLALHFACFAS